MRRLALALAMLVSLSATAAVHGAQPAHRATGNALIAPQGSDVAIGWVKFSASQRVDGSSFTASYSFVGAPDFHIRQIRTVVESLDWYHDTSGNFDAMRLNGIECVDYRSGSSECRPFSNVAQDWLEPTFPDWFSWEVPGVSWQNHHVVSGEIKVLLAP